jgi:magnesium transporter
MSEILEGLGPSERERAAALRRDERFFWIDVSLTSASRDDMAEALGIPEHSLDALLTFGPDTPPSRRFHADGQHVVFGSTCFLESTAGADGVGQLRPIEVTVLVSGDYLLTVHDEPVSLPKVLPPLRPEGRSEQYVVYAVLDAMVGTGFDSLNEVERVLADLVLITTDMRASRVRMGTLRTINARLSDIRRRVGPQRGTFERISEEIGHVAGLEPDSERYFERVHRQLNRLIDGVDATGDAVAKLIDLRVNETMYVLTVVATIFLPLTFVTGFFGMNFGWMVGEIDTLLAFVLLGVGTPILAAALIVILVLRRGTPVELDEETVKRPGQRSSAEPRSVP